MSLGDIHDASAGSKFEKLIPKNESKQEEQNLIVIILFYINVCVCVCVCD